MTHSNLSNVIKILWLLLNISLVILSNMVACAVSAASERYIFDDNLLRGLGLPLESLNAFTVNKPFAAGEYLVDLYVNKIYFGQHKIEFRVNQHDKIEPCFTQKLVNEFGIYPQYLHILSSEVNCAAIQDYVNLSSINFDVTLFRLSVSIPQAYVKKYPRNYISPATWQRGETMTYLNYQWNHFYHSTNHYTNMLFFKMGVNWELWRAHLAGSYIYPTIHKHWVKDYLNFTRILPDIQSELTLYESHTSGIFFPTVFFRGVKLAYDERMLAGRWQGYAPVVRGVALTNARVVIRQNGRVIYSEVIPAGPFEINDLYPNASNGDLYVEVIEADQRVSSFVVPFSALPGLLRDKQHRYEINIGQVKPYHTSQLFLDSYLQYGVSNFFTALTATQLATQYQALLLGGTVNTSIGAVGMHITYKRARITDFRRQAWLGRFSYSRYFPKPKLAIAIAGSYQFSPCNFELISVTTKQQNKHRDVVLCDETRGSKRLDLTVNKSLDEYGALNIGSFFEWYRNRRRPATQFTFTYNNQWRMLNYGITLATTQLQHNRDYSILLSVTVPLGATNNPIVYRQNMLQHSDAGFAFQNSLSGNLLQDRSLSYSLNLSQIAKSEAMVYGATLQKKFSEIYLTGSYSHIANQHAASLGLQGSVVLHRDGVTLGPIVGNSFALVEAPGASGAKIVNQQGSYINRRGFAIVPSLVPYRRNSIILEPDDKSNSVDILASKIYVTPYAGAALRVKFKTEVGYPIFITLSYPALNMLPLGSSVYDQAQQIVGVIGQNNQLYLRSSKPMGKLTVKWGNDISQQCQFNYQISPTSPPSLLYRLQLPCIAISDE